MSTSHSQVVPLHRPVPVDSVQGTLALDLHPRSDPPDVGPDADVVSIDSAPRARFESWARRFTQAAVEIAGGDRPVSQLVRWTTGAVYRDLGRRGQLVARAAGRQAGQGGVQQVRPQVRGIHTSFVRAGVAEVCAHVRYGGRSRAVALRFEYRQERWLCTALEFA